MLLDVGLAGILERKSTSISEKIIIGDIALLPNLTSTSARQSSYCVTKRCNLRVLIRCCLSNLNVGPSLRADPLKHHIRRYLHFSVSIP